MVSELPKPLTGRPSAAGRAGPTGRGRLFSWPVPRNMADDEQDDRPVPGPQTSRLVVARGQNDRPGEDPRSSGRIPAADLPQNSRGALLTGGETMVKLLAHAIGYGRWLYLQARAAGDTAYPTEATVRLGSRGGGVR
jgi:hypothetical protein